MGHLGGLKVRILLTLAAGLAAAVAWATVQSNFFGPRDSLRLGAYDGDVGALEWIAQDMGFFARVGLDVELRAYPSGNAAVEAMRTGQVDVATAADLVVAKRGPQDPDLGVFADICRYWNKGLVARRDRGIGTAADLRGKRIGVPLTSSAEHNLTVFLAMQGLSVTDVTIVDTQPGQFADRLAAGDIDAGMVWQPHVLSMEQRLGDQAIKLMDGGTEAHLLLVASRNSMAERPRAFTRLLKGLILAEEWVEAHPDQAKAYMAERFKLGRDYVEMLWPRMHLGVDLPQEILEAMDSEARWLAKTQGWAAPPNYADTVQPALLAALKPKAVGVFTK
jgi:NitT/TauT family transport system substrate-binding protein